MRAAVNRSGIRGNRHSHAGHSFQLSGSANLADEVRLEGVSRRDRERSGLADHINVPVFG